MTHWSAMILSWKLLVKGYGDIQGGMGNVFKCHLCKGNPLYFRSHSRHPTSLPQHLQSYDIVRHLHLTRFPSNPLSAYDTLT